MINKGMAIDGNHLVSSAMSCRRCMTAWEPHQQQQQLRKLGTLYFYLDVFNHSLESLDTWNMIAPSVAVGTAWEWILLPGWNEVVLGKFEHNASNDSIQIYRLLSGGVDEVNLEWVNCLNCLELFESIPGFRAAEGFVLRSGFPRLGMSVVTIPSDWKAHGLWLTP